GCDAVGFAGHGIAVVAARQAYRADVVVILVLGLRPYRDLGRDRAVEIHGDLLGVTGVVVVGVVPVDRAGRHEALLVGCRRIAQQIGRASCRERVKIAVVAV